MNDTYIAKRLLEHGPLTCKEFTKISGWPSRVAAKALENLQKSGVAFTVVNEHGMNVYHLYEITSETGLRDPQRPDGGTVHMAGNLGQGLCGTGTETLHGTPQQSESTDRPGCEGGEAESFAFVEKVIYDRPNERLVKQWLEHITVFDFYKASA